MRRFQAGAASSTGSESSTGSPGSSVGSEERAPPAPRPGGFAQGLFGKGLGIFGKRGASATEQQQQEEGAEEGAVRERATPFAPFSANREARGESSGAPSFGFRGPNLAFRRLCE
jgi:hypothetical protein